MNETLPVVAQSPSLVPTTMGEAFLLADKMASARLVPQALQKSPGDCLLVIMLAQRWGMDPFAVAQEVSVIRGKLMVSGKLTIAAINTNRRIADRMSFTFSGEGDNRAVTVSARLISEAEPRTVTVRLRDVRTENEAWKKQVDQQLIYSGARMWSRRHMPEVILGIGDRDDDLMIDVTPRAPISGGGASAPIADTSDEQTTTMPTGMPTANDVDHDEDTGEIGPRTLEIETGEEWAGWGQRFIGKYRSATSVEDCEAWWKCNKEILADMEKEVPKMFASLKRSTEQHKVTVTPDAGAST